MVLRAVSLPVHSSMLFTTSWDDGHRLDGRLAELLARYGATGTFYLCPGTADRLTDDAIRALARTHEVGAHTMTHPRLTRIPAATARREIIDAKRWVESVTGSPCRMFCYPYGDENLAVRGFVRDAGFIGARTVTQLQSTITDPFGMPTTLQIYPFPWRRRWTRWYHLFDPFGERFHLLRSQLKRLQLPLSAYRGWLPLAKALFLHALRSQQSSFHLWGHSWEIERLHMWNALEAFLAFVVARNDAVTHVPNSALISSLFHPTSL